MPSAKEAEKSVVWVPYMNLKSPLLWSTILQHDRALELSGAVISHRTSISNWTHSLSVVEEGEAHEGSPHIILIGSAS